MYTTDFDFMCIWIKGVGKKGVGDTALSKNRGYKLVCVPLQNFSSPSYENGNWLPDKICVFFTNITVYRTLYEQTKP